MHTCGPCVSSLRLAIQVVYNYISEHKYANNLNEWNILPAVAEARTYGQPLIPIIDVISFVHLMDNPSCNLSTCAFEPFCDHFGKWIIVTGRSSNRRSLPIFILGVVIASILKRRHRHPWWGQREFSDMSPGISFPVPPWPSGSWKKQLNQ
jgi:hypothetical protein